MFHRVHNTQAMTTRRGYTVLLHYFGTAFCPASLRCHWLLSLIKSAHFGNPKYCLVKAQGHMERGHRYPSLPLTPHPEIYLSPDQTFYPTLLLLWGWVAYIPPLRWQFNGRPLVLIPVDDIATCHGQATIECPIILQWLFCCLNGDPDLGKSLTACQLPLSLWHVRRQITYATCEVQCCNISYH